MTAETIGERLAALYRDIDATAMRGEPICNDALEVEAIGFREFTGYLLGVVTTPWFLNLIVAESCDSEAPRLPSGALRLHFPAGAVDFAVRDMEGFGRLASCALISPMFDFPDQETARAAACAALAALFEPNLHRPPPKPRAGLDRRALFGAARAPERAAR